MVIKFVSHSNGAYSRNSKNLGNPIYMSFEFSNIIVFEK